MINKFSAIIALFLISFKFVYSQKPVKDTIYLYEPQYAAFDDVLKRVEQYDLAISNNDSTFYFYDKKKKRIDKKKKFKHLYYFNYRAKYIMVDEKDKFKCYTFFYKKKREGYFAKCNNYFVNNFEESKHYVVSKNAKTGIIDPNFNVLVPLEYDFIKYFDLKNEIFIAQKNNKYGIIGRNYSIVAPMIYDNIQEMGFLGRTKGMLLVSDKKEGFFYDQRVILEAIYDEIIQLHYKSYQSEADKYVIVKLNQKYGVFDFNSKEVLPIDYDEIDYYFTTKDLGVTNGVYFLVRKNNEYSVFNDKNKMVIPYNVDKAKILLDLDTLMKKE
ncbi:WG repeat-containing protein [Winogradskyella sp.]|jgi:hypothetical protein|uniref:WG repeat-containing protein n=1 Tax=Winogradskyella sp. TaxID=1883156 RepID=UPI0025E18004|nr:WG repeat-containing protein [Winogradskyella sp.]MCT4629768.1 WG repeat-containing protein [Winogradskyella sp.]